MTDTLDTLRWLMSQHVLWVLHVAMALSGLELLVRAVTCGRCHQWQQAWGHAWHLGAGLGLMAALHVALTSRDALWILGWLSVSGLVHGADIWWARRVPPASPVSSV